MADIKQAAKWMLQGRKVRRPKFFGDFAYCAQTITPRHKVVRASNQSSMDEEGFLIDDLLADDWEIAE